MVIFGSASYLDYDVDQSLSASYMVSRRIVIPPYVCVSCLENINSPLKKMNNRCNTLIMLNIFIVIDNKRKSVYDTIIELAGNYFPSEIYTY